MPLTALHIALGLDATEHETPCGAVLRLLDGATAWPLTRQPGRRQRPDGGASLLPSAAFPAAGYCSSCCKGHVTDASYFALATAALLAKAGLRFHQRCFQFGGQTRHLSPGRPFTYCRPVHQRTISARESAHCRGDQTRQSAGRTASINRQRRMRSTLMTASKTCCRSCAGPGTHEFLTGAALLARQAESTIYRNYRVSRRYQLPPSFRRSIAHHQQKMDTVARPRFRLPVQAAIQVGAAAPVPHLSGPDPRDARPPPVARRARSPSLPRVNPLHSCSPAFAMVATLYS